MEYRIVICSVAGLISIFNFCSGQDAPVAQRETSAEIVYNDHILRVYVSGPSNHLYTVMFVPDVDKDAERETTTILEFEPQNFEAAVNKLLDKHKADLADLTANDKSKIARDLYIQIVKKNAKNEIGAALALEKEKINIGILRVKRMDRLNVKLKLSRRRSFFSSVVHLSTSDDTTFAVQDTNWRFTEAQVAFEDGILKDILISAKRLVNRTSDSSETFFFRNVKPATMSSPTDIADLNTLGQNILEAQYSDSATYQLDFASVLSFERRVPFSSGTYRPEDQVVRLNRDSVEVTLYKPSIERSFDIRIYTDLTGIQEKNPNGLVQLEGKYQIIARTKYAFNIWELWGTFFPSVSPFLTFSKIEDKTSTLPLNLYVDQTNKRNSFNYASTFDLFRYSHLHLGIDVGLVSATSQSLKLRLDLVAGIFRTAVDSSFAVTPNDSLVIREDKRNILSSYIMPDLKMQFINSDRIDFEAGMGVMFSGLIDRTIKQTEVAVPESKVSSTLPLGIDPRYFVRQNAIWKFQGNINIHPDPSDRSTAIFLRSILYLNSPQNNLLMQIGYATPIAKIFSSK